MMREISGYFVAGMFVIAALVGGVAWKVLTEPGADWRWALLLVSGLVGIFFGGMGWMMGYALGVGRIGQLEKELERAKVQGENNATKANRYEWLEQLVQAIGECQLTDNLDELKGEVAAQNGKVKALKVFLRGQK